MIKPRFVEIPAGDFLMGTDDGEGFPEDAEGPRRTVATGAYAIDRFAVTNEDFTRFVDATGYVTEAERWGWSFVFHLFVTAAARRRGEVRSVPGLQWWRGVSRAYWRKPEGHGSSVRDRMDHPVVHVSYADALAYCAWAGVRLPTETEWERAARGGLVGKRFPWGDELTPDGVHRCNIWQGTFPTLNTHEDGYVGTCPVDAFEPNGYGLYNCSGNVWEWCADPWQDDPERRVMRGGSYLCHESYCNRYRVAARSKNAVDTSTGNLGFRVARDVDL